MKIVADNFRVDPKEREGERKLRKHTVLSPTRYIVCSPTEGPHNGTALRPMPHSATDKPHFLQSAAVEQSARAIKSCPNGRRCLLASCIRSGTMGSYPNIRAGFCLANETSWEDNGLPE